MFLRLFFLIAFLSQWLVLTEAQAPAQAPEATVEPDTTQTEEHLDGAIGPDAYPEDINPLTGLVWGDDWQPRRPIIVKVSNSPALVRPQAGIGQADIVYEHYTEVGITRFSAIFWSQTPERVGSIRSARLLDYELVPMYQGLLAFAGASIGVDKRIYGSEIVTDFLCQSREDREQCEAEANVIAPSGDVPPSEFAERAYKGVLVGTPSYFRDETVPIPHNFFVNLRELWALAERDGWGQAPDLQGMAFHPDVQGTPDGSGIYAQIRYRTTLVEWHYDFETGRYYRSSDGQRHFDANTDTQVQADNVVIVYAGHYLTDIVESQYNDVIHWSAQITVWPQGDAVILRDGVRYDGRWLRPTRGELMWFETHEDETLYLKPGQTWIQVVPLSEQMTPESEWVIIE
jgi:hypothetical protein